MADYGRPLEFGISVVPEASQLERIHELVHAADESGLDLVGIQDHPYQWRFVDTWTLIAVLAARTDRIRFFPDVANLPLRPPAPFAKAIATLGLLTDGRVELGIGAGAFWQAIEAMGGPQRSTGEAVDALEEAIQVIRLAWSGERTVSFDGRYYSLRGYHPGPAPSRPIGIWVGAYRPRMLRLTGRLADGWVPSFGSMPPDKLPAAQETIDQAARAADRNPADIQRLYNVSGTIGDQAGASGLVGSIADWIALLTQWATELGMDTFIFWPAEPTTEQVELFATEIAPGVRDAVAERRG
jgi:alkanesulfonate monooxygenase SsuD/methylene tetrahydromethanopterin reductase-like flavin-dependent oxidoreductase (luciferase family)